MTTKSPFHGIHRFHAVTAGMIFLLSSCDRNSDSEAGKSASPPQKVKVATVGRTEFSDSVEALGTVQAMESIELSANVTETITALHFEDGDHVKAGQLLAELNEGEEDAMLAAAEAQLEEPSREAERLRDLVAGGAVSEVRLQGYETQIDIAKQRIEEISAQIADRKIEAPFDGVLGFRRVSVGALVSPGDVITTLDVLHPIKFDFTVPETFLSDLTPGLELVARSDAWPDVEFRGKVTQIGSRVNPVTRAVTVRAEVPNEETKLRPGMLMTTLLSKNKKNSVAVPERAIVALQRQKFVFVVETGGDTKTVRRVAVEVDRRKPGYAEIAGGLEEGQQVVTDGLLGLRDGAEVEIIGEFNGPSAPYTPGS